MKTAISLHTKELVHDKGQGEPCIPSDLFFSLLTTIFHFSPSSLTRNCTHLSRRLGNELLKFFAKDTLPKTVNSPWAY